MALQPGLCRTWSETPKTGLIAMQLIYSYKITKTPPYHGNNSLLKYTKDCMEQNSVKGETWGWYENDKVIVEIETAILDIFWRRAHMLFSDILFSLIPHNTVKSYLRLDFIF